MARAYDGKDPKKIREDLQGYLAQGMPVKDALLKVGRSQSWYELARREDREWAKLVDEIRKTAKSPEARTAREMTFAEFSEEYLFQKVFPHGQNMVDVLEGRDPGWLHPAMNWEPGVRGAHRLLINIPPNHAKTTTISVNYVVYRLMQDPSLRVMLISKTQEFARKMLYSIKQRLTHPRYARLQLAYGPPGGWKASAAEWSQTKIYLERDDGEKDPSVEAVGIGGQVYGARADLIILDDAITLSNAGEYEKQMDWIRQEVSTRLGPSGQLLVVGTRVASLDLYRELRNPDRYADGVVPWSVLTMPAVLEYTGEPEEWVTLWPTSDEPLSDADVPDENGFYDRWTGPRLAQIRNEVGPTKWSMVYQNSDVDDNATFPAMAVYGSVNKMRRTGPLEPGRTGHPETTDGFVTVCALDPAIAGTTACVAMSVDRQSGKRWVLDVEEISNPTPAQIRDLIERFTDKYTPSKFVIETNAFQGFLAQDEDLLKFFANRGVVMVPHVTQRNKVDEDMGVAAMAPLFGSVAPYSNGNPGQVHQGDNLMELPSTLQAGPKSLVEQLIVWTPTIKKTRRRDDAVMALWMAVFHTNDYVNTGRRGNFSHFMKNPYLSERDKARQVVVNLADYEGRAIGW